MLPYNIEHALIFVIHVMFVYVVIMTKRGVSTERFENIHYIRNLNFKSTSTDLKLSTNTYLMSVAALFQKLYVKVV